MGGLRDKDPPALQEVSSPFAEEDHAWADRGGEFREAAAARGIGGKEEEHGQVTIFLTRAEEWKGAAQHPEAIANLPQLCLRGHLMETRFACFVPPEPMTLIIQDERNSPDRAVFLGLGAVLHPQDKIERAVGVGIATVLTGQGSARRHFNSPNDVPRRWPAVADGRAGRRRADAESQKGGN